MKKEKSSNSFGLPIPTDNEAKKKMNFFHFPQDGPRDLTKAFQCELCTRGFKEEKEYRLHAHR